MFLQTDEHPSRESMHQDFDYAYTSTLHQWTLDSLKYFPMKIVMS